MWQHADDFLPFMTLDNGDQMTLGNRGAAPRPPSAFMVAHAGPAERVRAGFGTPQMTLRRTATKCGAQPPGAANPRCARPAEVAAWDPHGQFVELSALAYAWVAAHRSVRCRRCCAGRSTSCRPARRPCASATTSLASRLCSFRTGRGGASPHAGRPPREPADLVAVRAPRLGTALVPRYHRHAYRLGEHYNSLHPIA